VALKANERLVILPIVNVYHGQAPDQMRWYKDTETGNEVPGVSSIVDMMPKSALIPWAARLAAEYVVGNMDEVQSMLSEKDGEKTAINWIKGASSRFSNKAANEGTAVHHYAEEVARAVMNNTKPKSDDMPKGMMPYLKNYVRFLKEFDVEPVMLEETVWEDEVGYAGRFDMVARLRSIDNALCIIDTKSGASGVWESVSLQQTAYKYATRWYNNATEKFEPMPDIERTYALWLRPEGFALIPVDSTTAEWEQFKRLRESLEWKLKRGKKVIKPAINTNPIKRQRRW
jgi:hypothetical protein